MDNAVIGLSTVKNCLHELFTFTMEAHYSHYCCSITSVVLEKSPELVKPCSTIPVASGTWEGSLNLAIYQYHKD